METILQDLRYSFRSLRKSPGFTIAALVVLMLGIGTNSVIFTIVNAVLLRPLPLDQPERVVFLWGHSLKEGNDHNSVSVLDLEDWKKQSQSFEAISPYAYRAYNLTGQQEPEPVQGAMVGSDFFRVVGKEPIIGRTFQADDERQNVVVLSHSLWQRRFNSDASVLGQSITMSNTPYTVVGVMPPDFIFPRKDVAAWTSLAFIYTNPSTKRRDYRFLKVLGRLKPGVSVTQGRAEINSVAGRLEQQYPETNTGLGVNVVPVRNELLGDIRPRLLLVWAAVGFVLLIACANLANLLVARTAARGREVAVRAAVGATRWRIIRQLLTESLLLSFLGGLLAFGLAFVLLKLLATSNPGNIPRFETISLDARSILFIFGITCLTGIIFGLIPALRASKQELNNTLKEGGRGNAGTMGTRRLQNIVIVTEIALSLVLLVGTGLMLRSFIKLSSINLGYEPSKLLSMYIAYSRDKYPERPQQEAFLQRLLSGLEEIPGVESAGLGMSMPPAGLYRRDEYTIPGRTDLDAKNRPAADFLPVSPHYFKALKVPLLRGREFTDADKVDAPKVVIINKTLSDRFFANEDPVGRYINLGEEASKDSQYQIVGVVGDVRYDGLTKPAGDQLYFSYLQQSLGGMLFFMRTSTDPEAMKGAVRKKVFSVDFEQPVRELQTMDDTLSDTLAEQRFNVLLLSIFAVLALTLTAVGVYSVVSYSVSQRRYEIGIRMTLGAARSDVLMLILKLGLKLVALGLLIGMFAAFALTRVVGTLLYDVSATDPVTFGVTAALLGIVALVASVIPARRAMQVNPIVVLRQD
jgi:predicted permease